jgi:hypothetical protein
MDTTLIPISIIENGQEKILHVPTDEIIYYNYAKYHNEYNGFKYRLVNNQTHWCAYIILDGEVYNKIVSDNGMIAPDIYAYGDFTFNCPFTIGFDFAHSNDIYGSIGVDGLTFDIGRANATYKTWSYVQNECHKSIDSIIAYLKSN